MKRIIRNYGENDYANDQLFDYPSSQILSLKSEVLSRMERERNLWGEILEFNDEHFPNWRETHPIFYSNALAGETGEICNLTKKLGGGGTNRYTPDIRELAFELVDIHFYLTLLAESLKIDRELYERYFHEKMEVLRERMKDEVVWRERKALKGFNIPLKTPIDPSNPPQRDSQSSIDVETPSNEGG